MKKILLLLIFFCNSFYSQSFSKTQISENKIGYFKSQPNNYLNGNKNIIFNESDPLIMTGISPNNHFGISVSEAGDVNGDGYSDVIVGAEDSLNTGRAYIYFGGINGDNIADITMFGDTVKGKFGCSVSTAGDLNNDGFSDVVVGARSAKRNGKAYIFYGGTNMDNIVDVTLTGEAFNNLFGISVSTAGDLNGDGFSDIIVGANNNKAYIYLGGISMDNIVDITIIGGEFNTNFGNSVSLAGDVNGDGYSDVIIGAYSYSIYTGKAYIYYGGSVMNNTVDVILQGETINNFFGGSVSKAGDVNGDGYSDVIVGAENSLNTGRAYIYFGGSTMNNIADVILTGEGNNDKFGCSVSNVEDINGDGYSDVIVGAKNRLNIGQVYIFYGGLSMDRFPDIIKSGSFEGSLFGNSVSSAGDFNINGIIDIIVGASNSNSSIGSSFLFLNLLPKPELINPANTSINVPIDVNFSWNKLNTPIYYVLFIAIDSEFNSIITNDTIFSDTSKTVFGFQRDTKYFWKVKAKDTSGSVFNSPIWNFRTIPPLYLNIKLLFEGMYSSVYNQISRKDSIAIYLREIVPPFSIKDSTRNTIDTILFSNLFKFYNATTDSYYISAKHLNSIETWSKAGGEYLTTDETIYNYDFTISNTQAFGNNLKLRGSKYCLYSGDVNQDGFIDLVDVVFVYNDATNFVAGNYLATDLTGEGFVDLSDVTLCYNNSTNFIRIKRP